MTPVLRREAEQSDAETLAMQMLPGGDCTLESVSGCCKKLLVPSMWVSLQEKPHYLGSTVGPFI